MKRSLWDKEFAAGRWDYIEQTEDDCIYPILARYSESGDVLDLGCGSGNTGNEMEAESYRSYTGIDISEVAVEKARSRSARAGRREVNSYEQGDIYSYSPRQLYKVILFRESLFYIPKQKIVPMLMRYRKFLEPGGVFIVRMCDREKYAGIVDLLEANFAMREKQLPKNITTVIAVFC